MEPAVVRDGVVVAILFTQPLTVSLMHTAAQQQQAAHEAMMKIVLEEDDKVAFQHPPHPPFVHKKRRLWGRSQ